jgi:hypothetical protein
MAKIAVKITLNPDTHAFIVERARIAGTSFSAQVERFAENHREAFAKISSESVREALGS